MSDTITAAAVGPITPAAPLMNPRQVNFAMAGLTLSLFVAQLSNLVVLTALPRIVADLHGGQASYTWIVTASMLTITVTTPIWGRLSDTFDRKRLLQLCVGGYVGSSCVAGLAGTPWLIIACRAVIGVCAAGIIVLMQAISAEITAPRLRARWIGYRSAIASAATVGAPTIGGFVAAHLGWRWCFFIAVPVAIAAIIMVQMTLRLAPHQAGQSRRIDWPGAMLFSGGLVILMVWVSVVGPGHGWASREALGALLAGILILCVGIRVELRHRTPMLPLVLFRQRAIVFCVIAAAGTGFAFFGSAVFLSVYLQIGRGFSPAVAGLMAIPEAVSALVFALLASRVISRTGRYKMPMIAGAAMICLGFGLLGTVDTTTPLAFVAVCVALVGGGLGMVSENLVLVVQTSVEPRQIGSAGALVAFFRMAGGVSCVAALGAVLGGVVGAHLATAGFAYDAKVLPQLATLAPLKRLIMESAYSDGIAHVFLACLGVGLVLLTSIAILPNNTLAEDA